MSSHPIGFFDSGIGGIPLGKKLPVYYQMKIPYIFLTKRIVHMVKSQRKKLMKYQFIIPGF
jgi:Glutamate racemase